MLSDPFKIERSLPAGHLSALLSLARRLELPRLLEGSPSRERNLVLAMICQRVIAPASKPASARALAQSTLADELSVQGASEEELYAALDWLAERQESIEERLARRHLRDEELVLYDLSSSYFEGQACPLAKRGYWRDGKRGSLQILYGLLCDRHGRPLAVEAFDGNLKGCPDPSLSATEAKGALRPALDGRGRRPRHGDQGKHRPDHRGGRGLHHRAEGPAGQAARPAGPCAALALRSGKPCRDHRPRPTAGCGSGSISRVTDWTDFETVDIFATMADREAGRGVFRRFGGRRVVLGIWSAALLLALPLAAKQSARLSSGGFVAPGSGSAVVDESLHRFPDYNPHTLAVVLHVEAGDKAGIAAALRRVERAVAAVPGLGLPPIAPSLTQEAATGGTVLLPLRAPASEDAQDNLAVKLRERLRPGGPAVGGVRTYLIGQAALWAALDELSKRDLTAGERVGFPVVLVILLAVFGGVAAASLPLLLGGVAVVLGGALIYLLSLLTQVSIFATDLAAMLGIGVAVDYSLFLVVRYQLERRRGAGREEALARALATSGRAIAVSGLTVCVSLAGLVLIDSTVVRSMAAGAVAVVVIAVLGALTLTPALIPRLADRFAPEDRLVGRIARRIANRRPPLPSPTGETAASRFWAAWARRVASHPLPALLGGLALLLALAVPALSVRVGDAALDQFPAKSDAREGMALLAKRFGAGVAGPLLVVVRPPAGGGSGALEAAVAKVKGIVADQPDLLPGVRSYRSLTGREALLEAIPRSSPDGEAAQRLVGRLRGELAAAGLGTSAAVGGTTAETVDYNHLIAASLWRVIAFIAVVTFLLLTLLLRSPVLAVKAVAMTALTVAASYGILVAIFQWRWLGGLLNTSGPRYLTTLTPPFVLALTFGLSMDYQVFLLSRIRERRLCGADDRRAVEEGVASTAGAISAAALIMVAVFAGFAAVGVPSISQIGVGMAVAIALDATVVRLVVVPAAMRLLGRFNWWFFGRPLPAAAGRPWEPGAAVARQR